MYPSSILLHQVSGHGEMELKSVHDGQWQHSHEPDAERDTFAMTGSFQSPRKLQIDALLLWEEAERNSGMQGINKYRALATYGGFHWLYS